MNSKDNISKSIKNILEYLGEDSSREGLIDTPKRVENSLKFLTSGYRENPIKLLKEALFKTTNREIVVVKNIEFYSMCEHHMLPFFGKVSVGYIPNNKVVGLSKIPRLINIFARRLQIQEQLTEEIANSILEGVEAKGVAVYIEARHMCMEMRGVEKHTSNTITQSFKGEFKMNIENQNKFYNLFK